MLMTDLTIRDAKIVFPNFAGKAGNYNPEGRRNFCVVIDREDAERLAKDGWNVRYLKPIDEMDEPLPIIQVRVNFDSDNPPRIVMIKGGRKSIVRENSVSNLDWAQFAEVNLIINPYRWVMNGRSGITGYLKTMYVTIEEDEFEAKYRDIPDSAQNIMMNDGIFGIE